MEKGMESHGILTGHKCTNPVPEHLDGVHIGAFGRGRPIVDAVVPDKLHRKTTCQEIMKRKKFNKNILS